MTCISFISTCSWMSQQLSNSPLQGSCHLGVGGDGAKEWVWELASPSRWLPRHQTANSFTCCTESCCIQLYLWMVTDIVLNIDSCLRFSFFKVPPKQQNSDRQNTVSVTSTVRILSYSLNKGDVCYQVKNVSLNSLSPAPAQTHEQVALNVRPETKVE